MAETDIKKQDLRVIKTHKTIRTAFIELLNEKEFDNISVQEILDKALINRNTFYKYYSGKSDLAGKMIADFKADYAEVIAKRNQAVNGGDLNELLEIIMPEFFKKRQTILALWKIKTKRHHLYDDMFLMIKQNYIYQANLNNPNSNLDYQGELMATIALTTAKYYFKQDLPVPIKQVWQEMGEIVQNTQRA